MDNASKNAGDMIGSLQMQYNRGRQASITNELVDIITGLQSSRRFAQVTDVRPRCQRLVISENSLESAIDSIVRCNTVVSGIPNFELVLSLGFKPPPALISDLVTRVEPAAATGCSMKFRLVICFLRMNELFV